MSNLSQQRADQFFRGIHQREQVDVCQFPLSLHERDELLGYSVAGAAAHALKRGVDDGGAHFLRGDRVGYGQPKIVMSVETGFKILDWLKVRAHFCWRHVSRRINDVTNVGTHVDCLARHR